MKGKFLPLIGTALTLVLTTNVAFAESSKSPIGESDSLSMNAPTEIKLSLEGMKILCERSPLNSRCPGGTALVPVTADPSDISVPLLDTNTTIENPTTPETLMPDTSEPNNTSVPAPESFMQNELEFQPEANP
ncbi:hypothetical protein VB620_06140 [Nodularia harveyana UHCC-0300]|uniref:Uncharacterized protein n=1 Tax=Nodularia harveyana UHCC-0300 TaxID=2974287 RepID=A0ABU5UC14_9CYAN|nr:hypothetical protein [Nodularia harveyana]MEA5580918.1 hypothetical protein [Nodularia harveyana UHCC-0300]